jgi:hypothetical protein
LLHQILMQETLPGGTPTNLKLLVMMKSLNAAEAAKGKMDPVALIRVYVASATQVHLSFQSDLAALLAGKYLALARGIFHSCAEDVPSLAWLFKPDGDRFFQSRRWCDATGESGAVVVAAGAGSGSRGKAQPGCSLERLGLAFRAELLERGLKSFFLGDDTEGVEEVFYGLRQCAAQCEDEQNEWWGAMGQVIVAWRHGKPDHARQVFCEVDQMAVKKDKLQQFVYVACRAHQALLDGRHTLCWQALTLASSLAATMAPATSLPSEEPAAAGGETAASATPGLGARLARLVAYHHLLSTRVALLRLRTYLGQHAPANGVPGSGAPPIQVSPDAPPITTADILANLQTDVTMLRAFSDECTLAKPSAHLYQAIHRSLVGGKTSLTERIFHHSLKVRCRIDRADWVRT